MPQKRKDSPQPDVIDTLRHTFNGFYDRLYATTTATRAGRRVYAASRSLATAAAELWEALQAVRAARAGQPYTVDPDFGGALDAIESVLAFGASGLWQQFMAHPQPHYVSLHVTTHELSLLDSARELLRLRTDGAAKGRTRAQQRRRMADAVTTLQEHPEWPDRRIAKAAGVNPSTLSRSAMFKKARALQIRGPRQGYRTAGGGVEAID